MVDTLLHKFHSAKADFTDATLVRPSNWNDNHTFSGGTDGQLLARKAAADGGFEWVDPVTFDYIDVATYATGGSGTLLNPYTGWESAFASSIFKRFYFRLGYFQTSTALVLATSHPDSSGLCGYFSLQGGGLGSVVLWEPTGAVASGSIPEISASAIKTWLTVGATGKQAIGVQLGNFTLASTDSTFQKRGIHAIDFRFCRISNIFLNIPNEFWHDSSRNSIAVHIEGRGQNVIDHLFLTNADYPLIIGGSPNEPGVQEFDTNTVSNLSLAVCRGGASKGPEWVAHPNIYIQHAVSLTRNVFSQINMNGGSYGIAFHGTMAPISIDNTFDACTWEDPCPLDPSTIAASRIAADVSPSTMVIGDTYGDNAALEPSAAWGYCMALDMSDSSGGMANLIIRNCNQLKGGNALSLHKIFGVFLDSYYFQDTGKVSLSYPGQLNQDGTNPLLEANKSIALDNTGVRIGGPVYPCYPIVALNCRALGYSKLLMSGDIDLVYSLLPDPIAYTGTNVQNIGEINVFVSPLTVWDSIKDTNGPGAITGTSTWRPRLLAETSGTGVTATLAKAQGLVSVQNIGGLGKLATFSFYIEVSALNGISGSAYIAHTNGDNWGTALAEVNGGLLQNGVSIDNYVSVDFTVGHVSLGAFIPAADQRIVLAELGDNAAVQLLQATSIQAGTIIAGSGHVIFA